jgi:hypothetical protein
MRVSQIKGLLMKPRTVHVLEALAILLLAVIGVVVSTYFKQIETGWILVFVGGIGVSIVSLWYPRYAKRRVFDSRPSVSIDKIYEQFYSDSGLSKQNVENWWRQVANILSLPADKLRPTDRFGIELGPYRGIDDEMGDLEKIIADLVDRNKLKSQRFNTLDDLIKFTASINT